MDTYQARGKKKDSRWLWDRVPFSSGGKNQIHVHVRAENTNCVIPTIATSVVNVLIFAFKSDIAQYKDEW